ncbi:MAG: DUF1553 domain-containing protein [Verrucomicrobiales bacterium]
MKNCHFDQSWKRPALPLLALALLCLLVSPLRAQDSAKPAAETAKKVRFNRDVRPILSDNCWACHGPDSNNRKAGLRLDIKGPAFEKLESGHAAIVPGDATKSRIVQLTTTHDQDDIMPPSKLGKPLKPEQIATLKTWIEQGAEWEEHWAYVPVDRPSAPEVKKKEWVKNPIDAFIAARLEKESMEAAPEADRASLIRRVSFDLRGLPPTIEEVDAFLADKNDNAYEALVDRLLDTEQYGERMAQHWLDLARYADTNGYHIDNHRDMWKWREWVIEAFNQNMPFDQFTIEQLAGDLLPNATISQKIASGFNRNGMVNFEGGADPDEYQTKYVVDRVATTSTVWLGSTLACAECHDHKYDPFSQKEFYQFYAFFNNIPERGLDGNTENPVPSIRVPTAEQSAKLVELVQRLPNAELNFKNKELELPAAQVKWEKELSGKPVDKPDPQGFLTRFTFNETIAPSDDSRSQKASVFKGTNNPSWVEGKWGKALKFDGQIYVDASTTGNFERNEPFSISAWVKAEGKGGVIASRMDEGAKHRGYDFGLVDGKLWVHIVSSWETNAIKVISKENIPVNMWQQVAMTYDGSSKAAGVKLYLNGKPLNLTVERDALSDTINTGVPFVIGRRLNSLQFTGVIDDVRLYSRALSSDETAGLFQSALYATVSTPPDMRSEDQRKELAQYFKDNHATEFRQAERELNDLRGQRDALFREMPSTMVMEEMATPRKTQILVRGDFRNKGEEVKPGVPKALGSLPEGMPANRLALAKWLVDPKHPLTSRVTVNRFWQMLFGTGLVKTANDFGSQGEWPSHPELLDWLASEFQSSGWDMKKMMRLLVTSSAYRQGSMVTPEKLERDRYNRFLTRGPRFRLDAEMIRDNALAVSGLLNPVIGGKSVFPYQPPGLWEEVSFGAGFSSQNYVQSKGKDLYRRGMYTYWKRSLTYPSFVTFDAPSREICTFSRPRTSTPLQSLVLMNDPVYVEAARVLGQRLIKEGGKETADRLKYGFKLVLGRSPEEAELSVMTRVYHQQLENFKANKEAAEKLLGVGESERDKSMDASELAAWTAVGNVFLNLDETITKI